MSKKYEKLTIKISAQTAYHLDQISRAEQCSIGRVVDKLVRDRRTATRPGAIFHIGTILSEGMTEDAARKALDDDAYRLKVNQVKTDGNTETLYIEATRRL